MSEQKIVTSDVSVCQGCGGPTEDKSVNLTMWAARGLVMIEDVPVRICDACQEQYYETSVSERIQELVIKGFPKDLVEREITVPVFSLPRGKSGRLPELN